MSELHAYLDGTRVGTFTLNASGKIAFAYDDDYRSRADATPMSLSMRPTRSDYGPRHAAPFLAGLLPDSPDRLRDLATRYRTTENPFRLLEHVGHDAAGAVQLLPPGEDSPDASTQRGDVARLTDDDLDALLSGLVRAPGTWGHDEFGGRWSLAGAQSKVALFRFDDDTWGVPNDSTPTTHILKPAIDSLPDHDVNEYVSMAAARALGLRVADHELLRTATGTRVFLSARYDRRKVDGLWRRLHQEDFCQALSVDPTRKYQEQGGPSVKQIAAFLRSALPVGAERDGAQRELYDALVFNVGAQATDAHAKNFSVLLEASSVRLAPLYDLGSHAAYPTRNGVPLNSAMSIGDEYRLDSIGERQFVEVAKSFAIPPDEASERYRRITGGVAEAYDAAARLVDEPFARTLADAVAANADKRGWTTGAG